MRVAQKKQKNSISQVLATTLSFGLFLYFGYHLLHGDHGYFAKKGLEQKLAAAKVRYEQKLEERIALENRVRLMRPDSLDLDLLDERTRVVLGFMRTNERLIVRTN